jgi:hypothetical protein
LSHTDHRAEPYAPGPRHMRKRRFRREIPDHLLPGGPSALEQVPEPAYSERPAEPSEAAPKTTSTRTKRMVALGIVILVSISVPIMIVALILAG